MSETRGGTLPRAYFDDVYAADGDPWGFRSRWYEERKRALVMAALPDRTYTRALEVGCSNGVLTQLLATRTGHLDAFDLAPAAVAAAVTATTHLRGVVVTVRDVREPWPDPPYDLVVLSEVLYYLAPDDLAGVLARLTDALAPEAVVAAVHWRHPVTDYPQSGDAVNDAVLAVPGLRRLGGWLDEDVRLDVLQAGDRPSVAAREGLVRM